MAATASSILILMFIRIHILNNWTEVCGTFVSKVGTLVRTLIQVHNGRSKPIVVHAREWTILDARGVTHSEHGAGLGGLKDTGKVRLKPGQALGYQGTFQLPTSTAIIVGRYFVALDEQDVDRTTYEVVVAPMGASTRRRRDRSSPACRPRLYLAPTTKAANVTPVDQE